MESVFLHFIGWYDSVDIKLVPEKDGIYIAHAIKWADDEHNHFHIKQLVYIGKASGTDNLQVRINKHITGEDPDRCNEKWIKILREQGKDVDEIEYSYALYDEANLGNVELALIYANENIGIFNDKGTHGHDKEEARKLDITLDGNSGGLRPHDAEKE